MLLLIDKIVTFPTTSVKYASNDKTHPFIPGQKGIGFKSVFRVTDSPEVHSNGFHIKYDASSGPNGYILPQWVQENERTDSVVTNNANLYVFFILWRPVIFLLFCGYCVYTLKYSRTYDSKHVNEKEKVEKDKNYICSLTWNYLSMKS